MPRTLTADRLERLVAAILAAAGAPDDSAARVARVLVDNQLAGHDSHGIVRLRQYLAGVDDGRTDPAARPEVASETPTTAVVDGNWAFGQLAADLATDVLVDKALAQRVASVSVLHANHTGRLAVWTERAAAQGIATFMTVGTVERARTAPFGGAAAVLGTNPIAFSLPNASGPPVTLDYATSAIANGKIMVAQAEGRPLPPGVIINKQGEPTTDPGEYADGGFLLPFGGHKGYALAVLAELLGCALTGADDGSVVPPKSGIFLFGIAHDAFRESGSYHDAIARGVERITSVPTAPGVDEVLVPGMPEARAREQRERDGLPIGDGLWEVVVELARERGVDAEALAG